MADKETGTLSAASALDGTELVPIVQGGNSRKATAKQILEARQGTSFPGSPASGDRYRRTDRQIDYTYDGTRWLSDEIFSTGYYNAALAGNQNFSGISSPFAGTYDIYIGDCVVTTNMTAGSTTFTFDLYKFDGTSATLLGTTNTTGDASAAMVKHTITINAVVTSTFEGFQMNVARTSGAATLGHGVAILYRLVG